MVLIVPNEKRILPKINFFHSLKLSQRKTPITITNFHHIFTNFRPITSFIQFYLNKINPLLLNRKQLRLVKHKQQSCQQIEPAHSVSNITHKGRVEKKCANKMKRRKQRGRKLLAFFHIFFFDTIVTKKKSDW